MNMFSCLLSIGFWERRAMDAVGALALCLFVIAIGGSFALAGILLEYIAKRRKNK